MSQELGTHPKAQSLSEVRLGFESRLTGSNRGDHTCLFKQGGLCVCLLSSALTKTTRFPLSTAQFRAIEYLGILFQLIKKKRKKRKFITVFIPLSQWEFPGGLVVRIWCCHHCGPGSTLAAHHDQIERGNASHATGPLCPPPPAFTPTAST